MNVGGSLLGVIEIHFSLLAANKVVLYVRLLSRDKAVALRNVTNCWRVIVLMAFKLGNELVVVSQQVLVFHTVLLLHLSSHLRLLFFCSFCQILQSDNLYGCCLSILLVRALFCLNLA